MQKRSWINPSKVLVDDGISRWLSLKMRADNTSVVTVMIDPPGPPRMEVIRKQQLMKKLRPREEGINIRISTFWFTGSLLEHLFSLEIYEIQKYYFQWIEMTT